MREEKRVYHEMQKFIHYKYEQLSFAKSFESETFSKKCLLCKPTTEYRRVNTEKNSAQHTKESCNMNSLAQQCWHLFANII